MSKQNINTFLLFTDYFIGKKNISKIIKRTIVTKQ